MNKLLTKTLSVTVATGLLVAGPLTPNLDASEVSAIETSNSEMASETPETVGYTTQNVEVDTNQGPMTYGQVFGMGVSFTDAYGHTFNNNEMIGYQAAGDAMITEDLMTYSQIAASTVNINWGTAGTYAVELQFDNSRFDDGSTPYSYVNFTITIVQAAEPVEPEPEEPEVEKPVEKPTDNGNTGGSNSGNNSNSGGSSNSSNGGESIDDNTDNTTTGSTNVDTTIDTTTDESDTVVTDDSNVADNSNTDTTSAVSNDTNEDNVSPTVRGNYVTQNLNLSIYQSALTYGQIFDIMDIEFTNELGRTYYPSEMTGVSDGVVNGVESYEHIRNRKAAVSWGHKGTYEFRLQFDNSRYYDQNHKEYGYVDFRVTIVGEEVIDQTYVPDYNGVKGDMLTTTWKNGRKVSTIVTRKDGSTKFRSTYYNDSSNRIETKTYYDTNNHYTSKYYYNNDANKTIQKSYKYNKPGTSGYYTRYEYVNGVKDHAYKYEAGERVASYTFFKSGSAKGDIQYKYYWETVNGHAIKTRKQEFNTSGHTIKNTYYSNSGKLTKVYKYNKPGTSGYYTRYMYDSNGVKERAYRYENGKQTASYTFFKSGSAKGDIQVKYYWKTVNGHLIKTRRQELNTSGHTIENRYYSDNGKLTKVYKYSKPGTSGYYTRYMYDSNGVKEKSYKYENGNLVNSYSYYKSGSAKGSIKSKYYYHTSHGKTIKDKRVDYDTHGHVTKTTRY